MYFDVSDDVVTGVFDRAASSWFLIVAVGLTPAFTAITVWQDERKLVRREVTQHVYGLSVFLGAKTLVLIPVEIAFGLVVRTLHAGLQQVYLGIITQCQLLCFVFFASGSS